MKKWTFLLVCLFVLGLCTACTNANKPTGQWSIAEESTREFTDVLQLRITEIDLSENTVTYDIENSSEDTYSCGTGADFALEVLQNGVWHNMRADPSWGITLELHILPPGETMEFTASLRSVLPSGTYRLVKEVSLEEASQNRGFLCCEFIIK